MIDFKKELLKFQPAQLTDDDLLDEIVFGEVMDLNEVIKQLITNIGSTRSN